MSWTRISADVWVNLDEIESVTRNIDGTALLQGKNRIYESTVPCEAIMMQDGRDQTEEKQANVSSPLISETRPAW